MGGNFSYDEKGEFYHTTKIYGYIKKQACPYSYKFLLGLLNSQLFWFFIQQTGYVLRGGYCTFKTNYILPFPLPCYDMVEKSSIALIENKVEKILLMKKKSKDTDIHEEKFIINQEVYKIYNLSEKEVLIVED